MDASLFWVILSIAAFVVFWGVVIGAVILVARAVTRGSRASASPRDPAIDALRTRYARGDIDDAEFERLRSVLQRH